jgi:trans-2,3-dihydro-3-hydroxyanthranilate isomerase
MKVQFYTCDVFTDRQFGGNQLAVFPDAAMIPEHLLPSIAREFNFSETSFVYPPDDSRNTAKIRIFTPGNELTFAGHPTIGTAITLATIGRIRMTTDEIRIVFEEGIGPVPVSIAARPGAPMFAQLTAAQLPEFFDGIPSVDRLAAMLSLSRNDLDDARYPIQSVSVGFPFLYLAVKSRNALKRIRVNIQVMEELRLDEVFIFAADAGRSDFHFRARMFAPLLGIPEDPATGSAAASFAGYLARLDPMTNGTLRWNIEQGFEMGRPSVLYIEADKKNGSVTATRVGGNAVMITEGYMNIS